jgi:hypothetical protein
VPSPAVSAINTANCAIIQTYNVGDTAVPNDPGDDNYSSTDEAVARHGSTLCFANAGNVAQSADGYEPTGIALTATSTPGS